MQEQIGQFLFRWRNLLFPVLFLSLFVFVPSQAVQAGGINGNVLYIVGVVLALAGAAVRLAVAGVHYVKRAGRAGTVHADDLFIDGPFALVRNPLYVGNMLIASGFMVMLGNVWLIVIGVPVVFLAYQSIIAVEEKFLTGQFGERYAAYTRDVPRWLPKLSRWNIAFADARFDWRQALVMDYSTTGAVLLGLFALAIRDELASGQGVPVQMWVAIGAVVALIATVRILKKSGRLRAP